MIHSTLRGRGFHIRRIRRRRHLVHHGRVLVAVLSVSRVLLSVRVSNVVLFCSLGFLACGLVSLDLPHLGHIVGIVVLLLVLLVLLGEYPFYNLLNFVVCLDCFLRCNFPSLSRLRVDFCAGSSRPCLGTLLSPGPFCHSGLGKTSVPLVMSSPLWSCLMSCITSLCTLSCT